MCMCSRVGTSGHYARRIDISPNPTCHPVPVLGHPSFESLDMRLVGSDLWVSVLPTRGEFIANIEEHNSHFRSALLLGL